ncbi:MSMEG_0570 family nitrogen starvation response protein [Spirosoma rhododendri]|uniref:MSMEG_0570 family nitrogen starvation response protein n=1 Tax=Spirosoma rhododendri TaxID=2728024 RepID=A0A7L5DSB7_9BACT|nr:MSMEG_0570 family nitrogen starvation response protein [Spirosoma rhododendri]QJD80143.1 MSMEG_0570 family nitrogen starvation response protein [Spirosoma rhododendri]
MPETYVHIQWPDGRDETIYSPSSVIRTYFEPGTELNLPDFEQRCATALQHASRRVRETYGYECTAAMAEKHRMAAAIQAIRRTHPGPDESTVRILTIH